MYDISCEGLDLARFSSLRKSFEENFSSGGEVGAAVAVVEHGKLLASFWGGNKNPSLSGQHSGEAWTRDTLVNIWSTTKGVTAVCLAMLVDRGLITYDTPLAEFWPAFREGEKKKITLSMLLSHQAGLCGFREPVDVNVLYNLSDAANQLAAIEPFWPPGEGHGYHALSVGLLASELVRLVDGRSLKKFINEELHNHFNLDIHIGLPEHLEANAAPLIAPQNLSSEAFFVELTDYQKSSLMNPLMLPDVANTPEWKAADIPSANGFATAESLAILYGAMVNDGVINGRRLIGKDTLLQAISPVTPSRVDKVLGLEVTWANGFLCNTMNLYGPNTSAFGHSGWGGSFAFGDPDSGIGFAYTMNRMGGDLVGDPRATSLVAALYKDLQR